jgi:hypothetical protein
MHSTKQRIVETQDEIEQLEELPADKLASEAGYEIVSDVANPHMTVSEMLVHLRKRLFSLQVFYDAGL